MVFTDLQGKVCNKKNAIFLTDSAASCEKELAFDVKLNLGPAMVLKVASNAYASLKKHKHELLQSFVQTIGAKWEDFSILDL